MPDTRQLLAGVRAKYPGAYDSTPDDVLLSGVKKKFPGSYDSYNLDTVSNQPNQPNPNQIQEDSAKYGALTETPTMLERAGANLTSKRSRPMGMTGGLGVALGALGIPEEDILPAVGQAAGGMVPGFVAGTAASTGGAVAGQGIRQLIKKARGEKADFGEMGKEALTTGAIEGVTRGAGGLIFRRQIANEALGNLSKKLGEMKKVFKSNTSVSVPSEEIYMPLKEAMEGVAVPRGEQASVINRWLKFMEQNPNLSSKNLVELESDLGKVAKYGEFEKGALQMPVVNKPELNAIAKGSRKQVSGIVDEQAEGAGQKGWKNISQKISKLLKNPEKTDVTKSSGGFGSRLIAAGAVGGATQNWAAAPTTYLALQALQSPELRNLAFKAGRSPVGKAVGKGTKLSLSELARRQHA